MKKAIAIVGNLRTFLMPLRENKEFRLYHNQLGSLLKNNPDADIFVFTDTNDFFYDDALWISDESLTITNQNPKSLYKKIVVNDVETCREIITKNLKDIIPNLRSVQVENPYDCTKDKKTKVLKESTKHGSNYNFIGQIRKNKLVYEAIKQYESNQGIEYDVIVKTRFDNCFQQPFKDFREYSDGRFYCCGGLPGGFCYDWYGIGNRKVMDKFFTMYDCVEDNATNNAYLVERCPGCGSGVHLGNVKKDKFGGQKPCPKCDDGTIADFSSDVSIAPEYILGQTMVKNNISIASAGVGCYIYRYLADDDTTMVDEILKKNDLSNVKVNFISGHDPKSINTLTYDEDEANHDKCNP